MICFFNSPFLFGNGFFLVLATISFRFIHEILYLILFAKNDCRIPGGASPLIIDYPLSDRRRSSTNSFSVHWQQSGILKIYGNYA